MGVGEVKHGVLDSGRKEVIQLGKATSHPNIRVISKQSTNIPSLPYYR